MSVYDFYFNRTHEETENEFGVPLCRSFAMTGIRKMLDFKSAYTSKIEEKLNMYKKSRIFHLWDYHFVVTESVSGYRYLTITNERITPQFVDVVRLGNGTIDLHQIVDIAQDLYQSLLDEGKPFDYKAYFRNVFIPKSIMTTEKIVGRKLKYIRVGNENTLHVCFNYNGTNVFFWISEAFYNPPVIQRWFTNQLANKELNQFDKWYKFESIETKLRKIANEIADEVLI